MNPERNDAAESTAAGVLAGLRAVWCHLGLGPSDPRRVVVQGLGSVGRVVARRLSDQGVRVIGADPDPAARALAAAAGVELAHPDTAHRVPCDVFMPCALGGGLTTPVARELHCRALCGSANNQLGDDEAAGVLRERNIVHAPDVIVSAGAVIEGVITVLQGTGPAARALVRDTIARLESTTAEVLREAEVRGEPPDTVARRRGRALLSGA
jgi:leucine dehydrogenase